MTTLSLISEAGNRWGQQFIHFAWPMLWQSSLLMTAMFLLDIAIRRKIRASVRYALWLVVIMKLLLPPSLAFPTGPGWWLREREVAPLKPQAVGYVVTYGASRAPVPLANAVQKAAPKPEVKLSAGAWALSATFGIALALLGLMLTRWRRLQRELRASRPTPRWLAELVCSAQREIRYRRPVRVVITDALISPALWGLFRPVIILPATLIDRLSRDQLRAVLLHELFHLRNGDVWFNCFQSLLQIVYWWHPLFWLANSRIRRVREEAVDDAVRLALGEEAESYPPTLLEVARLALARPLATLGLVGILESRHALRQRVERLTSLPAPRKAGLTMVSVCAIFAFAGVALPMGQAPAKLRSADISSKLGASTTQGGRVAQPAPLAISIQPSTENGGVEFDSRSGIATATNGAVLRYGDTTLSADNIILNRETGEVVAEGSATVQKGDQTASANKIAVMVTNLQLAQLQAPVTYPSDSGQGRINGRKAILNKLNAIRLDNVVFDNLPLSEVVNYLSSESKKRDPEGKGINFMLMPYVGSSAPGSIDPATGLPIVPSQENIDELNSVIIRLLPALNDVRMVDVLDAITKVADKPIRYSIQDYAVSFRMAGNEPSASALFSRSIQVDPGVFAQGLESVVGFSVGNFQTGSQGGGGGQQGNGISVPRVQVVPNAGAGQGGQGGGVQGGVGGISGVTRPSPAISPQAVRQFFMNAGVDLTPPKSVSYNDRSGTLTIRATTEDIDTMQKAIAGLPSFSAQPQSAKPNGATFTPVSALTNQDKVPILGDLPALGKVFTKTVEVAAATPPSAPTTSAADTSAERLFTRTIRLDVNNFFMGVQQRTGLSAGATPEEMIGGFRKLLFDAGVQIVPPKTMFYNANSGTLLVRASEKDLETIEQKVLALSVPPPAINIKARFVEIPKGDTLHFLSVLKDLRLQNTDSGVVGSAASTTAGLDGSFAEVLTDEQFRDLLKAVEKRDGANLLTESSVTTLSGRQAQIQVVDITTVVLKINPQALVSPGVSATNVLVTENLPVGPILDVIPVVGDDGMTVSLDVTATVNAFLGYDEPVKGQEEQQVYVDGKVESTKLPHPRIQVRQMQHEAARVTDGQTLMLGKPKDVTIAYDKDGKEVVEPGTEKKDLLVFLTTTLIDSAGNPIHNSAAPGQK